MNDKSPGYKRLRGRGARGPLSLGRSILYLGTDHLLVIDTSGVSETYKRFYFRDIQAFLIRPTMMRWLGLAVLAFVAVFLAALGLAIGGYEPLYWGTPAGVMALFMLVYYAKGPSCAVYLKTAVHTEALPSLNRRPRAERTLATLRPLIEAAQADIQPVAELADAVVTQQRVDDSLQPASKSLPEPVRHVRGAFHAAAFGLHGLDSVLTIVQLGLGENNVMDVGGVAVTLALVAACVGAIVTQRSSDIPKSARRLVWIAVVLVWVFLLAAIVIAVVAGLSGVDASHSVIDTVPGVPHLMLTSALTSALICVLGFIAMVPFWRRGSK